MRNLRKRREAAGLSRYQLAKKAGVSPSTIEQIETMNKGAHITTAVKLAKALGTTVGDLLGEKAA